ncbi:hypothetical protein Droror1_Dr00018070, partial [Drosera rotundifolia]
MRFGWLRCSVFVCGVSVAAESFDLMFGVWLWRGAAVELMGNIWWLVALIEGLTVTLATVSSGEVLAEACSFA